MTQYSKAQLAALYHAADKAYQRISKTVEHDADLSKADQSPLGNRISLVQGALLDLVAEINVQLQEAK